MAQTWREFRLLYRWLQLLPATEVSRGPSISSWRGCSCLDLKGILQTLKPGHQLLGDHCEQTASYWSQTWDVVIPGLWCQLLEQVGSSTPSYGVGLVYFPKNIPVWARRVRALHHQLELEQGHGLQTVCLLPAAQGTECLYHPQTCCVCLFNSKL